MAVRLAGGGGSVGLCLRVSEKVGDDSWIHLPESLWCRGFEGVSMTVSPREFGDGCGGRVRWTEWFLDVTHLDTGGFATEVQDWSFGCLH